METAELDFGFMLLLGLVSSFHCGAMCGPFLVVASAPVGAADGSTGQRFLPLLSCQMSYHFGRALTYGAVGAILAALGVSISCLMPSQVVGSAIQVVVGISILAVAAGFLRSGKTRTRPFHSGRLVLLLRRMVTVGRPWGMFFLGVLTGFLPCGVLYVAFLRCVAAHSAWEGGLLMLAFWIGTTPLLLAVGFLSVGVMRWLTRQRAALVLALVLAIGGWVLYRGVKGLMRQGDHDLVESTVIHGTANADRNHVVPQCPGHL